MHPIIQKLDAVGDRIAAEIDESERLGANSDAAAQALRDSGVIRMLQPKEFGGDEAHPREFLQVVMELAARAPSIGWVAGVVGTHPFQFGQGTRQMQQEVWGKYPDTWIASSYAFMGTARRVDGGYLLSGQWPFSSGTDHCQWVVLGGRTEKVDGPEGQFTELHHFVLPRADYEILQDSWKVMGLMGTGSKDVRVTDAFVPAHRVYHYKTLTSRQYATERRPGVALYQMPFEMLFPGAIAAATLGIADGFVRHFSDYARDRVSRMGVKATQNPWQMSALGAALADIEISKQKVLDDISEAFDFVSQGGFITPQMQAKARLHQVRGVHRAAQAVGGLVKHAGGNSNRLSNPIQRHWRDLSVALGHACNVEEPVYAAYAGSEFGIPFPMGVII